MSSSASWNAIPAIGRHCWDCIPAYSMALTGFSYFSAYIGKTEVISPVIISLLRRKHEFLLGKQVEGHRYSCSPSFRSCGSLPLPTIYIGHDRYHENTISGKAC